MLIPTLEVSFFNIYYPMTPLTNAHMIKLTRIDDRLLHGPVAFTWTPALDIDCLLIANDKAANDKSQKMTLRLAKPPGVRLLITTVWEAILFLRDPKKNRPLKILLIISSVRDAHALAREIPEICSINFGGIREKDGAVPVSKAVALTSEDISIIRELIRLGIELEIRQVPTDSKQMLERFLP